MRLGRNRPGASTDFIDTDSHEILLRVACSLEGEPILSFRLYDSCGDLVAHTDDFMRFPRGVSVVARDGSVLLDVPAPPGDQISYCLYNREGRLLTCSDGLRTQVFAFLRMEKSRI